MSAKTEIIYVRGKFFIEARIPRSLEEYFHTLPISKHLPDHVIKKLISLIKNNEIDKAVSMWKNICINISNLNRFNRFVRIFFIYHVVLLILFLLHLFA